MRIRCCEDSQGIEVPGDYRKGEWNSQYYELDWESFTQKDVTDWLYWQGIFGFPDEDERLEFDAAAQATLKRCLVLAKVLAKSSKPVAVGTRWSPLEVKESACLANAFAAAGDCGCRDTEHGFRMQRIAFPAGLKTVGFFEGVFARMAKPSAVSRSSIAAYRFEFPAGITVVGPIARERSRMRPKTDGGIFAATANGLADSQQELASRQSESIKLRRWQRGVSERTAVREDGFAARLGPRVRQRKTRQGGAGTLAG